jgi:hypothetical protein
VPGCSTWQEVPLVFKSPWWILEAAMAKTKDILFKVWLRRGSDGILSRRICSGKIAEQLPTEQPQISNRQADMLIRNERDEPHHVEFQASNEIRFRLPHARVLGLFPA